ncbi:MAG: GTPase [Nanoarchaeota archaeon]
MPVNAGPEYGVAEQEYLKAATNEGKLKALQKMLSLAPKHKGTQVLVAHLKQKIAKTKSAMEKERTSKKGSGSSIAVKREGAAQIVLVGTANSGKSTLLKKLTNANVEIAPYPFTTKKPEVGVLDYKGVKLQIIEIPAVVKNFQQTDLGPSLLAIIKNSDLVVLMFNKPEDKVILDKELSGIEKPVLIYNSQEDIADEIWSRLNLIKVYTKQPGKKPDYPPVAMSKGSTIKDLAEKIHKDFLKKFRFARIWGKSVKFDGSRCGLDHVLADKDIVEFHAK